MLYIKSGDLNSSDIINSSTALETIVNKTPIENDVPEKGNEINLNHSIDVCVLL